MSFEESELEAFVRAVAAGERLGLRSDAKARAVIARLVAPNPGLAFAAPTIELRAALVEVLLSGVTARADEDAILDLLGAATPEARAAIVARVGREKLNRRIQGARQERLDVLLGGGGTSASATSPEAAASGTAPTPGVEAARAGAGSAEIVLPVSALPKGPPKIFALRSTFPDATYPDADVDLEAEVARLVRTAGLGSVTCVEAVGAPKADSEGAAEKLRLSRRALVTLLDSAIARGLTWADRAFRCRAHSGGPLTDKDFAMFEIRFDAAKNAEVVLAGFMRDYRTALGEVGPTAKLIASSYGVTFVTNDVSFVHPAPGSKAVKLEGAAIREPLELELIRTALAMVGPRERKALEGLSLRRIDRDAVGDVAGFYSSTDRSVSLMDRALPRDATPWVCSGKEFLSRGVLSVLHELAHAVEDLPVAAPDGTMTTAIDAFIATVVSAESSTKKTRRRHDAPDATHIPTEYGRERWAELFADVYAIHRTSPSFLGTPSYEHFARFFATHFPA
ncbi:hypothetical protein L6R52_25925 [Myxococcota bacterium]|nr:hypothetical protein [Myxococcota bacterium]